MSFITKFSVSREKLKLFVVGGLNQGLSSGTNFLISIYLVSVFSPESFGVYGIGFAVVLFIGGTGNAFFLTQMIVIYPSKKGKDKELFVLGILYLVIIFCLLLFLLTLFCGLLNSMLNLFLHLDLILVVSVIFASLMYLLKEFFVRTAYNYRKEMVSVYIHGTLLITVTIFFVFEYFIFADISTSTAFLIYGLSHLIAAIIGFACLGINFNSISRLTLIQIFNELYKEGKWASLTNLIYTIRSQAHTIIAAILLGTTGVGNLNAARLFITPAVMVIPVISQLAMPRLAAIGQFSKVALIKKGVLLTKIYLVFGITYSVILLISYDVVIESFFNSGYEGLYLLTIYWCVYAIMLAVRNGKDIIAQVLNKFRKLTIVNLISSIITILSCYMLTNFYGLKGDILGLIIGEFFLIIMLYFVLRDEPKKNNN